VLPLLLLLLFIVVPIAELFVIIQVGEAIGVWWTIALLLADAVLGSMLARSQGRAVWRRFNEALQSGRVPARETVDGALVLGGGAFLLAPGFLTDIVGALLLLPPTRAAIRALLVRRFADRMIASATRPRPRGGAGGSPIRGWDVDGTARDVPPDPLDRGARPAP
jgi:UPF0716 protein FxsA